MDHSRPEPSRWNIARFFVENRHVSWVLLLTVVFWGVFAVLEMPKRKDPEIPVRVAVAICPWPGASAEKMEQLVTRKIEEKMAENAEVEKIVSNTRGSVSVVYVTLDENVTETGKEFDDIKGKLDDIRDLPEGAGPVTFIKDFGDTAALMLTVASPKAGEVEIALRSAQARQAIEEVREKSGRSGDPGGVTIIYNFPASISPKIVRPAIEIFARSMEGDGLLRQGKLLEGRGFIGLDGVSDATDEEIRAYGERFIALGLLVDVPVVAGDAIKREFATGRPALAAAWIGPTKLAKAMFFATVTNIVAYLPFLILSGDIGRFLYTLPVVMTCALVSSWIISFTFTPLLSYHLLRPSGKTEPSLEERRATGFTGFYFRLGSLAIANRWKVLAGSLVFLAVGGFFMSQLKTQFFPKDLSYLSYVDVWLPEDATLSSTGASSVEPEQQQLNYAQLILQVNDEHDTGKLADPMQETLSREVPGTRIDVRQLENAKPVGIPVSVRISGEDIPTLRHFAEKVKDIFRAIPKAERIRDDWGGESFTVRLKVDPDRANLDGISNLDVAVSSVAGMSGIPVSVLREENKQIPVLVRLRQQERSQLSDIRNLYVYSLEGNEKVPLRQVSTVDYTMETGKIMRRNQFRTFTVSCFPAGGVLPSEIIGKAGPALKDLAGDMPPGYRLEIGGEQEEQVKGFRQLAMVMAISILSIFIALVIQFKNAVKPFIVFAAIPYGMAGAMTALALLGAPFGFMAFLGIVSLIGVIISHVIVLFDFIEEMHEKGEPLQQALLDAGIVRLRPVMITVAATVFALFPLAIHGGPLWQPLCYAQIGGLTVATFITLLMVPVLYAIAVLDLKIVTWKENKEEQDNP